jgi:hypothetical protein
MALRFHNPSLEGSLTLIVRPMDDPQKSVDAQKFFDAARKWLDSLSIFATDQGRQIRWEIAGLQKSSAVVEVLPIDVISGVVAQEITRNWEVAIREIELTGHAPTDIKPTSVRGIGEFVNSISDLAVSFKSASAPEPHQISANTQKRVQDAIAALPPDEYQSQGTVRGRLAVLNSWNQNERWFRLQLPLAPDKHVRCSYSDVKIVEELGETFEDLLEVTGTLHYRIDDPWPYQIEVERIRRVPTRPALSIDQLVGAIRLPEGVDSVSYVRSLRDAE